MTCGRAGELFVFRKKRNKQPFPFGGVLREGFFIINCICGQEIMSGVDFKQNKQPSQPAADLCGIFDWKGAK